MILKKVITVLAATAMITSSLTILTNRRNNHFCEAADSDLNYGALSYIINTDENGNDYIEITACSAEAESVVIPNTIGGQPVLSVGNSAFKNCKILSTVKLPDSLVSIGDNAFEGCVMLNNIEFPSSIVDIGDNAFSSCSTLNEISLQDGLLTIGDDAFRCCTSLKNVSLPNSVNDIGDGAFACCSSLSSINIPDGVTDIKNSTFLWIGIEPPIFKGQQYSTKYIDNWLVYCDNQDKETKTVYVRDNTIGIADGVFGGNTFLYNITLPDSIKYIGKEAFWNCKWLSGIDIPEGVTEIRESTFRNCWNLTEVKLPESLTTIGDGAFAYYGDGSGDALLSSITFPDGLISIGVDAFSGRSDITEVNIPDSVLNIGNQAFFGCKLSKVTLGNNVKTIGDRAFCCAKKANEYDMISRYSEVTIPKSVKSIGSEAFGYYNNYKKYYSFTINGYLHSEGERYAIDNDFQFNAIGRSSLEGDVNADGICNISDVVMLQKWLLAVPDTILVDWKAADLCEDDRLDVFDLCLMKRKLIYG